MKLLSKRWILQGVLVTKSPMIIGSGDESQDIDIIVMKDHNGKPYIPATSIAGVLRNKFLSAESTIDYDDKDKTVVKNIWGYTENTLSVDSSLKFSDSRLLDNVRDEIEVRDGVRINPKTRIAEGGAKFDYEIVPEGTRFDFKLELEWNKTNSESTKTPTEELCKKVLGTIYHFLSKDLTQIGRKTTNGCGKVELVDTKVLEFDFSSKDGVLSWLIAPEKGKSIDISEFETFKITTPNMLQITIEADIKNSLLVRSYSKELNAPDIVQLKSNGKFVIPGSSIKGVLRHRAEKIVNSVSQLVDSSNAKYMKNLFGYVETNNNDEAIKSRFSTSESTIEPESVVCDKVQTRIKIDRFTGGTIQGALLEEMPIWKDINNTSNDSHTQVVFSIQDPEHWEIGLALLLMKDIMTSDLPFGGEASIGRGLLNCKKATIKVNDAECSFKQKWNPEEKQFKVERLSDNVRELENYVQNFITKFSPNQNESEVQQ